LDQHFYVRLLGRFSVELNGDTVIDRSWSRRKAQALIKLLALRRDHAAHREEVLDLLWPELDPAAALNNLYKNLHHVRSVLAGRGLSAPFVALNGEMVELAPGTEVDAGEFREMARLTSAGAAELEAAASLYRGDLLPEDTYEPWTEAERDDLRSAYVSLMFSLARIHHETGNHASGIDAIQALLRADPANEEAHRLLIAEYAHSGSKHRALRQYQLLTDVLKEELDAEPSEETRLLYESLFESRPAAPSAVEDLAPAPASVTPHHRPVQLTPTFGREDTLETAQELIDEAQAGAGKSMLVWGEAGTGKSHFLNQVIADAEEQGFRTAMSRCSTLESSSAYQPFRDVLRQVCGDPRSDELVRHSPYLRRILYGASERDEQTIDPTLFQTELFNDAHRLIQLVAQGAPLLICLEDLHEADEDSVRMFHFLARRVSGLKVLLIASSRKEGPDPAGISPLVASLRRDRQVVELEMRPLPEQSMALLVESLFGEAPPDAALLREILRYAEGNPLYATEIVHTLVQEGWARLTDGRWKKRSTGQVVIPSAVNELLDIRLKRLSSAAQEQVQLAAVHGRDVDYPLLRATLGSTERDALDALDECIEASIIVETEAGYRFRHELLREGIYERLTRIRRHSLHKAIAQALEARRPDPLAGPQVEVISHHYALSDEPWLAIPYLLEAGRRAASLFANEQAVNFYEQVLALDEAHPQESGEVGVTAVLEHLGDIERRRGNAARSVELFERAQVLFAQSGDRDAATRVRGKAALGHIMLGDSEAARDQISATLQDLTSDSPQHVVSRTYYLLAQLHWHGGDNRAALEAAERALGAARDSDDLNEKAQAYEVMALACHSLGNWQRGVELELERQAMGVPGFDTDEAFEAHL
jgi:DNA-binding SARP family transcriptional activator